MEFLTMLRGPQNGDS
jgi:hypothetical protein